MQTAYKETNLLGLLHNGQAASNCKLHLNTCMICNTFNVYIPFTQNENSFNTISQLHAHFKIHHLVSEVHDMPNVNKHNISHFAKLCEQTFVSKPCFCSTLKVHTHENTSELEKFQW